MIESTGLPYVRWHDHFVVPRLDRHLIVHAGTDATTVGKEEADLNTAGDEEQILALRPSVLEQLQRHNVWRHLHPDLFRAEDVLFVNHYYARRYMPRCTTATASPAPSPTGPAAPARGTGSCCCGSGHCAGSGRVLRRGHSGPDEPLPAAPLHPARTRTSTGDRLVPSRIRRIADPVEVHSRCERGLPRRGVRVVPPADRAVPLRRRPPPARYYDPTGRGIRRYV